MVMGQGVRMVYEHPIMELEQGLAMISINQMFRRHSEMLSDDSRGILPSSFNKVVQRGIGKTPLTGAGLWL